MTNSNHVRFLDTTARDGKQAPGNNFGPDDTVELAHRLSALGIEVMEAGFPSASEKDFEAVRRVAEEVNIQCCALVRANIGDIDSAVRAFQNARVPPRLHLFIASSDAHMETKLKMSPDQVVDKAVGSINYAKQFIDEIEFSPEDASRTGFDFLKRIVREAILAGATTINIPDTTGYAVPEEFGATIKRLIDEVPEITEKNVVISVHCHNDLGMATANSLAGLRAGARQVHTTVNGIGERAGNTHYAEVAMAILTRQDYFGLEVSLETTQIGPTAQLLSSIVNKPIPDSLPIVGENVFAHSSGIHQHGVESSRDNYEIMSREGVGWMGQAFPLSSQSGRRGLSVRLVELGYDLVDLNIDHLYDKFSTLADTKVTVGNDDLYLIVQEHLVSKFAEEEGFLKLESLDYLKFDDCIGAEVNLICFGKTVSAFCEGNGPVDAAANAIKEALSENGLWPEGAELEEYDLSNLGKGTGSQAVVDIELVADGVRSFGHASNKDIVKASVLAIVAALNHLIFVPVRV